MYKIIATLLLFISLVFSNQPVLIAQDSTYYLVVTTAHWNIGLENFSQKEWLEIEKEYLAKVTRENQYVISSTVLTHFFTDDNTELKFINIYRSWSDIEKANQRSGELAQSAWPDEAKRDQFFARKSGYYTREHADEIYISMPGSKYTTRDSNDPMVMYMRVNKLSYPTDGDVKEFAGLLNEYNQAVIQKNEYIREYYPDRHLYGSDGRDYVEFFVLKSLTDIDKFFVRNEELVQAAWPDENQRKEFFDNLGKYFTGEHGDFIYNTIYELSK